MSNPAASTEGPTPGVDPVVTITLGSQQMRARRPSRGDEREIRRRYVSKLLAAAPPVADSATIDVARMTLDRVDGGDLYAEAQFEVLLVSRPGISFGEDAPAHWFRDVTGADGATIGRVVSFETVSPEEFSRAAAELTAALAEKKSSGGSGPLPSTDTAATPNSA